MKILIIGSNGQLGWELQRTVPQNVDMAALDYPDIDITDEKNLQSVMDEHLPDWIINCAAYTDVDGAEKEADAARAVNCDGAKNIAAQALRINARMVHISTDFIFNGNRSRPYQPLDKPDPKSVYGQTKLDGEKSVESILKQDRLIVRTAWLYSSHGNNFVKTMIRLMDEKEELTIIDDQIGSPTWANGLALTVWAAIHQNLKGIFHWTDAGVASWYDFAVAIQEEAIRAGLLKKTIPILPIPTRKYPTPAKRPPYSVLDKKDILDALGLEAVHWRSRLKQMIQELT